MTFNSDDDDSEEDHSREYSVEQLRASLKQSTSDLVQAANCREAGINIDHAAAEGESKQGEDTSSESSSIVDMQGTLFSDGGPKQVDEDASVNNNEFDYDKLDVADDIRALFECINLYEPIELELETPLKCFIPPYIPAVGDVDPMIKIPRPDELPDGIGITALDEIITADQSNKAVIELQLKNWSKTMSRAAVRSISNAAKSSQEIDEWIKSAEDIHNNEPRVSEVRQPMKMQQLKELLKPLPKVMREEIKKNNLGIPSPEIDLSLSEYAQVLCSLIGIYVHDGSLVESVHVMYDLFTELQDFDFP